MKYLIIGDANSMHIFNYVQTVLLPENFEIYLLTLSVERVKETYRTFYKENNIHLFSIAEKYGGDVSNNTRIKRFQNLIKKVQLVAALPQIDICHIHSVYKTSIIFFLLYRFKFQKLILSYWGGDIEDKRKFVIKIRKKAFKYADAITVTAKKTFNEFQEIYGQEYNKKLYICRFATSGLQCIHDIVKVKTKNECREIMKIPKGKICITCGYSAYASQHQDTIVEKINELPEIIKQKIHILVPMQYGRYDEEYIQRVHKKVEECDCSCEILEEYVPFEKSAVMSLSTDIYIHMRDTDAFSNALKEQVYSGSIIIQGNWLKYIELEEMGADVIKVYSFDELPFILQPILEKYVLEECKLFAPIYNLYSPEQIKKQWMKIIKKIER